MVAQETDQTWGNGENWWAKRFYTVQSMIYPQLIRQCLGSETGWHGNSRRDAATLPYWRGRACCQWHQTWAESPRQPPPASGGCGAPGSSPGHRSQTPNFREACRPLKPPLPLKETTVCWLWPHALLNIVACFSNDWVLHKQQTICHVSWLTCLSETYWYSCCSSSLKDR